MKPHLPELVELADKAVNTLLPEYEGKIITTRGLLIVELLKPDEDHRGVIAVDIGRQGELMPWDIIGLLAPVEIRARSMMSEWLFDIPHDDGNDG